MVLEKEIKIAFWFTTNRRIDPDKVERTPFGGCEIEALYLARELTKLFHSPCYIFCNAEHVGAIHDHGFFFHYDNLPKILAGKSIDVLIVVRATNDILNPRHNQRYLSGNRPLKIILWSGDAPDQSNNELLHDALSVRNIDHVVLKNLWQKEKWLENFPRLRPAIITVIRKGLNLPTLTLSPSRTEAPRFIYASTIFRGAHLFLKLWPEIKKQIPEATLDMYCRTTLYVENNQQEELFSDLYARLAELPGVTIKEPLPQREFFRVLPNYYVMLYPNVFFDETVCGVSLEAMASGVPVITSARAGLIEAIESGAGILLKDDPESDDYAREFVEATVKLWQDKSRRHELGDLGFRKVRSQYAISDMARIWQQTIEAVIHSPETARA